MSRLSVRLQLFGITLICVGSFHDLQKAILSYGPKGHDLGSRLVAVGVLASGLELVRPAFLGSGEQAAVNRHCFRGNRATRLSVHHQPHR